MRIAIQLLEIRADSYLRLVSDLEHHKAYTALLEDFLQKAYQDYVGYPIDFSLGVPSDSVFRLLTFRGSHWVNESYKRLVQRNEVARQTLDPSEQSGITREFMDTFNARLVSEVRNPLGIVDPPEPQQPIATTEPRSRLTEAAEISATPKFPLRAKWLKDRLKERAWDRNDVARCGGPDVKTVQKILDGEFIREGGLEKLVIALNHKKIDRNITLLDVPSN